MTLPCLAHPIVSLGAKPDSWRLAAARCFIGWSIACIILAFVGRPATAQVTTYTYTGNSFTLFSCGPSSGGGTGDCPWGDPRINSSYTPSNHVTATLSFSSPLPGNLSFQDVRSLPGFTLTLTDGIQTLHSADYGSTVQVSTDPGGNIIAPWFIQIFKGGTGNPGIVTYDEPPFSEDIGQLACCDPTVQGNLAINQAAAFPPGTGPGLWVNGNAPPSAIYPAGTFTRTTQLTICCDGFVVDNDDNISGGINKPLTAGGAGSGLGNNLARASFVPVTLDTSTNPPSVTNNGPAVGAYSDSNQGSGFGRAIAFATFTNNTSTAQLRAHGNLAGAFLQDWFGLPNGTLAGGAAIHVFDSDKFFAAITSHTDGSDASIGRFLLGGPGTQAGLSPGVDIGSIDTLLSSALIGQDQRLYSNGPFYPPAIGDTLNAAFTIPMGKNYTVVFDVVASGIVAGDPHWGIGTGFVDFIDTLKPAPVFFTDDNGNPVSGIKVVGGIPSLPPGPSSLTLSPPIGSAIMEHPYTLTATSTDSSNHPLSGAVVKFTVANGPDVGVSAVAVSNDNGIANFTYTGQGGPGTDTIQASTASSIVSNTVKVTWQAAKCPAGQGFWKTHSAAWPVTSLTLGGQKYSQAELLQLLNQGGGGDASVILAVQLIAAKLSISNGSDPAPIRAAGANADSLLQGFSGKLPCNVNPSTAMGQSMVQAAGIIQNYTEGKLTPQCTP